MNEQSQPQKMYKVLNGNRSYNGGNYEYSLPRKRGKGWQAGAWHQVQGEIIVCQNGFHLTTDPFYWFEWDATIYEAEGKGESDTEGEDKTAFEFARLLRPAPLPTWYSTGMEFVNSIDGLMLIAKTEPDPDWLVNPYRYMATEAFSRDLRAAITLDDLAQSRDVRLSLRELTFPALGKESDWDGKWRRQFEEQIVGVAYPGKGDELVAYFRAYVLGAHPRMSSDLLAKINLHWAIIQRGYGVVDELNGVWYVYER